jgi:hypothetical protein
VYLTYVVWSQQVREGTLPTFMGIRGAAYGIAGPVHGKMALSARGGVSKTKGLSFR